MAGSSTSSLESTLLAAHGVEAAELIGAGGADVAQAHARGDAAGEDFDEAVLAELVGNGLEHEAQRGAGLLFGGGAVVRDALEHGGGADVGHGVGGEHGDDRALGHADLQAFDDVGLFELHVLEELLHQLLGGAGGGLHQLGAHVFDMAGVGGGNGGLLKLGAVGDVGHVVHQVDDALAVGGGDGDGADDAAVLALEGLESLEVVAVLLVALGDAEHDGQLGLLKVFPAALGTDADRFRRVLGGEDDHAGLDSAQRAEHVADEVEVAGAVKHVDLAAAEVHGGDGGGNGDLAGGLFGVVVADGVAVADLAHAVDRAGDVEHALRQAGLAGVAVADQADIADVFGFHR